MVSALITRSGGLSGLFVYVKEQKREGLKGQVQVEGEYAPEPML